MRRVGYAGRVQTRPGEIVVSDVAFYDAFGDYDQFVNWEARLAAEMPFFQAIFEQRGVSSVLDVACGTGHHAIAFAQAGFKSAAADLSETMIAQAQENASAAGIELPIYQMGFGQLARGLSARYDAITCLGNSLPHLSTEELLASALKDMAAVLESGGLLVVQNRNFDRVLVREERFMPPKAARVGDEEWLFFRFYDFEGEHLRFNLVRLGRRVAEDWRLDMESTRLRAWQSETLQRILPCAGFKPIALYGNYRGDAFDPLESTDLVLIAQRCR